MTDREIYTRVFVATIGGYMACPAKVSLTVDGERISINEYADIIATYAVSHAPKEGLGEKEPSK